MTLRRCDRYLLREMLGPFLLALAGLLLFLLLNIVLSLTPLMVDRGISMSTLMRLVVLELPSLFVLAVPMAAMFATFLGLGRLLHDREIMALEAIGISLRRLLLPLIIAAALVSALDFVINNWAVPASERAFQRTYLELVFRQSIPRITPNAVFSGPNNLFFYVRRYDAGSRTLHDVLIYDTDGDFFPVTPPADTQVTLITAEKGTWTEETWELDGGRSYSFDPSGVLLYSGTFERLSVPVDQSVEEILSQARSPDEMGIAELAARVAQAQQSGQRTAPYVLEIHHKIALPLATIVFVVLGGTLSFAFGARGRAVGIIASLLLLSIFTGLLWWTQALGQRGAMHPALAAWLPNLLFGGLGLLLFLRVDRLASRDLFVRLRRLIPFLALTTGVLLVGVAAGADEVPLDLRADELFISSDRTEVRANGAVEASFEDVELSADALRLHQAPDGQWLFEATGDVRLAIEGELSLSGDRLAATIDVTAAGTRTRSLEAGPFRGESVFVNSSGESHTLYFEGELGQISFDEDGAARLIEIEKGELTTCNCCGLPFRSQPYTLRASRLLLYPDQLLVVFGLTARVGGVSAFWLPVYVRPLEETLESPLFPAIGRSSLRGWFLKWNVPFYLSEQFYGTLLFDYYHAFRELAGGVVLRYDLGGHSGSIDTYVFPAKVGDRILRLSLDHSFDLGTSVSANATVDYDMLGDSESLSFRAGASGSLATWRWNVSGVRSWKETDEDAPDLVTQRLPEFSVSREPIRVGTASITPHLAAGWVREWEGDIETGQAFRLDSRATLGLDAFDVVGFKVSPSLTGTFTHYAGAAIEQSRSAFSASVPATWSGLSIRYDAAVTSGESPFDFDRIDAEQKIAWQIEKADHISIRLASGYDVMRSQLEPLSGRLSWGDTLSWTVTASYDLSVGALQEARVRGAWQSEIPGRTLSASWDVPFDALEGRVDPIQIELAATGERAELSLEAEWAEGTLVSATGAVEARGLAEWGASASVECKPSMSPSFANPRFRVFRDIGDCIQVGIERASDQIWLYASIIAFPEAVLRYGTESASLRVGD